MATTPISSRHLLFPPLLLTAGGDPADIAIQFTGTTFPGNYSAILSLQDSQGAVFGFYPLAATVVPEPSTLALTSGALLTSGLVLRRRRRAVKP